MSFSDYLENELLDHVWGGADFTRPATVYVGLTTAAIVDADTGSTVTEPVGGSYARVAVTNNATEWPAAAAGLKSNGNNITFPTATASWGLVTHFFIADAATLGNILAYGTLTSSKTIDNGDTAQFSTGDIDITLD